MVKLSPISRSPNFPRRPGECAKNEPSGACPLGVVPTGAGESSGATPSYHPVWWGIFSCKPSIVGYPQLWKFTCSHHDWLWLVITCFFKPESFPQDSHMFDGLYVGKHPQMPKWIQIANLVGGLEHEFYFPIYWVANHPNWRSHIFQRGGYTGPPTSSFLSLQHVEATEHLRQSSTSLVLKMDRI